MSVQDAKNRATAEGWTNPDGDCYLLMPSFWQALGRSLKWSGTSPRYRCGDTKCIASTDESGWLTEGFCSRCGSKLIQFQFESNKWLDKWLELIHDLAKLKSIESYFEKL